MAKLISKMLPQAKIMIVSLLAGLMVIGWMALGSFFQTEESSVQVKQQAIAQYFQLPMYFEKNEGQMNESIKYMTRGPGYTFYFTPQEVMMSLRDNQKKTSSVLTFKFKGTKTESIIKGIDEQECKSNYFIGNDSQKWKANIPNYAKVCYQDLYPGIDAVFYGNARELEYDLCVAPGIDPNQIRLHIEGANEIFVDGTGDLQIKCDEERFVQMHKPFVYQMIEGKQIPVLGQFTLLAKNEVGFSLENYDSSRQLIIDPVLSYSSYLGGVNVDQGYGLAIDSAGNAYLTGLTFGGFPITAGAFQTNFAGFDDAFVTKVNPTGSALVYSTYLGGTDNDQGNSIAVDSNGNAYVTGSTSSTDFPTVLPFQATLLGGSDAFVTKLAPDGASLVYSTYLGGSTFTFGNAIAIDSAGSAYVTGQTSSPDFPTTVGPAYVANADVFVTKFTPVGSTLDYSRFIGGSNDDIGNGITVDITGSAYITGTTNSADFPVTAGSFQSTYPGIGGFVAFVSKLSPDGVTLDYSTYLGGTGGSDSARGIAIDSTGSAYVVGGTNSSNFPVTPGAFSTVAVGVKVFITKFNSTGTALDYSTFLGGSVGELGFGIAIDSLGDAYVTGLTGSPDFPTTAGAIVTSLTGSQIGFVSKFNATGSALLYSTYLGGTGFDTGRSIAVDSAGNAYVTGDTTSSDFPTTVGVFQPIFGGTQDAFISKLAIGIPVVTGISPNVGPTTGGTVVTITGTNLTGTLTVLFGTTPATSFIIDSDTQITVVSPPHVVGTVDVTVVAAGGTSSTSFVDLFTYQIVPTTTVLSVTPNPADVGQPVTLTATVIPAIGTMIGTNIVNFFDGGSLIGSAPAINGVATLIVSNFTVGTHVLTAVYTGNGFFDPSTSNAVTLTVVAIPPISLIFPPTHLKAVEKVNQFATQADYVNIVTWRPPTSGSTPVAYRIYRNAKLTKRVATVLADERLIFKDHNRQPGKTYTYYIVSVDALGAVSEPASVKITVKKH